MLREQPLQGFEVVTVDMQGIVTGRSMRHIRPFAEDLGKGIVLEMVAVPAGTFWMGSPKNCGYADEHPQHQVSVASFLMARYPVTQEQWAAIMPARLSCRFKGEKRPVENASWNDAQEFCGCLSEKAGLAYSLPSEAQWEYACRAQTTTPFYFGENITTDLANYRGEFTYLLGPQGVYRHQTTEVGIFPLNAFGLGDMHGNVWEWCADTWHRDYVDAPADGSAWVAKNSPHRVLRGGSWHDGPDLSRCAVRVKFDSREGDDFIGFRPVAAPFSEAAHPS